MIKQPPGYAILGWMYSGKGTLAKALSERNQHFETVNFGDFLKEDAQKLLAAAVERNNETYDFRMPIVSLEQMERDKHIFRPFFQWYSDTYWKSYMGDVNRWLRPASKVIDTFLSVDIPVICADVRYTQECSYLKHNGFKFIRVVRPEEDRQRELQLKHGSDWEHIANHPGEHILDNYPVDAELFAPDEQTIYKFARKLVP